MLVSLKSQWVSSANSTNDILCVRELKGEDEVDEEEYGAEESEAVCAQRMLPAMHPLSIFYHLFLILLHSELQGY